MSDAFFEARAWRIATQIVRRDPAELTLIESNFEDHYHLLSVVPRLSWGPLRAYKSRLLDVNRDGTMVTKGAEFLVPALEDAARGPTLLFDQAPDFYRELARRVGLPHQGPLPRLTPELLSFRFVVAWLQMHTALGQFYRCWQGVDDAGVARSQYFSAFPQPELSSLTVSHHVDQTRWHPAYRFWFLVEEGDQQPPVACIGSDGLVRTRTGPAIDMRTFGAWTAVAMVREENRMTY